ncbi:MAG: hypothetical protein ACK44A_04885 [Roseateles sp.]
MTTRDEALVAPHAGVLLLLQLDFTTGTQRYTNWTHSLDYFGHTWQGLGPVVGVSVVAQSEDLQFPAVDVQLNLANPGALSLALGNPEPYRRRPITIWQGLLDDELRPAGDPEVIWAGLMDQLRFDTGDGKEGAAAVMRCEMPGRDKRAATSLRLTHAQQQRRYPGDTGLSRIERMVGQPQTWLSKRFQEKD